MQVNSSVMLNFLLFCMVMLQFYSVYSVRDRIWCTFRNPDRTKISKWAKVGQSRIEFAGGWYQVEPDRVTLAIKWNPMPSWVRTLDFRHDSSRALDPNTFSNEYTPQARKQMDITDDVAGFQGGNERSLTKVGGKQNMLQQYMPLMVLIGFIVVGFFLYQQQQKTDNVGFAINVVQQQLGDVLKRLPK